MQKQYIIAVTYINDKGAIIGHESEAYNSPMYDMSARPKDAVRAIVEVYEKTNTLDLAL